MDGWFRERNNLCRVWHGKNGLLLLPVIPIYVQLNDISTFQVLNEDIEYMFSIKIN